MSKQIHSSAEFSQDGRGNHRGSILIVSLGILTCLAIMATTFVTLTRVESRSAINYADTGQLRTFAQGMVTYTLDWIWSGTPGGTPDNSNTNVWVLGYAVTGYSPSPELHSKFYEFTQKDILPGIGNVECNVKILDSAAQIYIGSSTGPLPPTGSGLPANLESLVKALLTYVNDTNAGTDPDFNAAVDAQSILTNGPYAVKSSIIPLLSGSTADLRMKQFNQINNFLSTIRSVSDDNTTNPDFTPDPRVPVNVNSALMPVLVGILDPVMVLRATVDQTAERALAQEIMKARPFSSWSDFSKFIRSDSTLPFTNPSNPSATNINLASVMEPHYADRNVNLANDWREEREVLLARFLPNINVSEAAHLPISSRGRNRDGINNNPATNTVVDEDGERDGVDNDSDATVDESDELAAYEEVVTTELCLTSQGLFDIQVQVRSYNSKGLHYDGLDNDLDGKIDESDEGFINSVGLEATGRAFHVWKETTQEQFQRGTLQNTESYPEPPKAPLTASPHDGWVALKNLEITAAVDVRASFTAANGLNADVAGGTNNGNAVQAQLTLASDTNRPGNLRVDGLSSSPVSSSPTTPYHAAYGTGSLSSSAVKTVALWVQVPFKPAATSGNHYLFHLPLENLSNYNTDGFSNDGDVNVDEPDEYSQFVTLSVVGQELWLLLSAHVDEGIMAASGAVIGTQQSQSDANGALSQAASDLNALAQTLQNFTNTASTNGDPAAPSMQTIVNEGFSASSAGQNAAVAGAQNPPNFGAMNAAMSQAQTNLSNAQNALPGAMAAQNPSHGSQAQAVTSKIQDVINKIQKYINELGPPSSGAGDGVDNNNNGTVDESGELRIFSPNDLPNVKRDISSWKAGEWHYVGFSWDLTGRTLSLFIDGAKFDSSGVPPGQWNTPNFNSTFTNFFVGAPPDNVILPASDNFPTPARAKIDELRIKNSVDIALAGNPGSDRYYSTLPGGIFLSGLYPSPNPAVPTPPFLQTRLFPPRTQLGTLGWTEYMPEGDVTADVTFVVEIDTNQPVTQSSPFNSFAAGSTSITLGTNGGIGDRGIGARLVDATNNPMAVAYVSGSAGARIRYTATLVPGAKKIIGGASYLLATPVIDDVWITYRVQPVVLRLVEMSN